MIKILIVDDSPTEVALIKYIIDSAEDMTVIGVAQNGREAIALTAQLKPDLITMDIQMPVMDGLRATQIIMSQYPIPIVVISSTINDESLPAIFHVLEAGALTAIAKPDDVFAPTFEDRRKYIIDTLRSLSEIRVTKKPLKIVPHYHSKEHKSPLRERRTHYELVAIGASIGGPIALKTILSQLPVDFPVPIVVVQHMSIGFISGFTRWLQENIDLKVKIATDQEVLHKGTVYIAPEQMHLEISQNDHQLTCHLVNRAATDNFCPSITRMLQSVAAVSGAKAIGVLLTGMSDDGALGLLELKKAGGHTVIQNSQSAVVFGMGAVAQSMDAVDKVIDLKHIANYLIDLCIDSVDHSDG
ncbi:MAG: chemotaxis-specific protein-glutamate methyltransferase CheB [Legionella sp.]|uniref:chemotaxis-specific protein-glutamate methyltransferase CheB n=1 Tax=Legionella sp. TaxID=459 RepID=UPI0039E6F367